MIVTVCGKLEAKLMKRDEARDVTRFIGRPTLDLLPRKEERKTPASPTSERYVLGLEKSRFHPNIKFPNPTADPQNIQW